MNVVQVWWNVIIIIIIPGGVWCRGTRAGQVVLNLADQVNGEVFRVKGAEEQSEVRVRRAQ